MPNSDIVLNQKTVLTFFREIQKRYNLKNLPTNFSDNSPISQLLKQPITVSVGDEKTTILYTARGSPLDFIPFNFGANLETPLNLIVIITVTQEYS